MSVLLPQKTDIEKLSVEELSAWLKERNMTEIATFLHKRSIDGHEMLNLREEMLVVWGRELKIRMRLELLKLIKGIKNQGNIFPIGTGESKNEAGINTQQCCRNINENNTESKRTSSDKKPEIGPHQNSIKMKADISSSTKSYKQGLRKGPVYPPIIENEGKMTSQPHAPIIQPWTRPFHPHRAPPSRPHISPPPRPAIMRPEHHNFKPRLPLSSNTISKWRENINQNEAPIRSVLPLERNAEPSQLPRNPNSCNQTRPPLPSVPPPNRKIFDRSKIETDKISKSIKDTFLDLGDNKSVLVTPLYRSINSKDFFHAINRNAAIKMLSSNGMFLVRPSTHTSNPLTLSLFARGAISHISIRLREDGKFALGLKKQDEKAFVSVEQMVDYHKRIPIKKEDGSTTLLHRSPPKS